MSHSTITAAVVLESLSKDNFTVTNRRSLKQALISTVKEENSKFLYIKITPLIKTKAMVNPVVYPVVDMILYARFIHEGIATIKLPTSSVQILINNCPTSDLELFLMTLKVKVKTSTTSDKEISRLKSLGRLLPRNMSSLDVISPIRKSDTVKLQEKNLQKHFDHIEPITPEKKRSIKYNAEDFTTPPNKKMKLSHFTSTPNDKSKFCELDNLLNTNKENIQRTKSVINESLNDSFQLTEYYNLTKEQIAIVERVKSGENVFFTGSAGTGKTFLLKKIIGTLTPQNTAVTASTGVAASLIDGCTLHSFAGIGIQLKPISVTVDYILSKPQLLMQWRKCKHLIIDEVSLITAEYFDHLDKIGRALKNNPKHPFGGIQMILSGDFFQLPPVISKSVQVDNNYKFVFQSHAWKETFKEMMFLTEVKRQVDREFIDILSEIRMGRCSDLIESKLKATARQKIEKDGIIPTMLCTHKVDVEEKNNISLNALPGAPVTFYAHDSIQGKDALINQICPAESKIDLKIGAQVMLVKNLDLAAGLANGSRGVVVKFSPKSEHGYPIVRFSGGLTRKIEPELFSVTINVSGNSIPISRKQLPLKLAYAISIHKSQGMTLDCVDLYLAKTFECGQAYVALSRCKSLSSLRLMSWAKQSIRVDKNVLAFYNQQPVDSEKDYFK